MNPKANRIFVYVALVIAAIGMATWMLLGSKDDNVDSSSFAGRKAVQQGDVSNVAPTDLAVAPPVNDRLRTPALVQAGKTSTPSGFRPALFNENIQALIASGDLVRIDYGILRVRTHCLSAPLGRDAAKAVREAGYTSSMFKGADLLAIGNAPEETKTAAFARSYERCRGFLDPPLSDKEYSDLTKMPISSKALGIMRQLSSASDFDNPETKDALTLAVNGPMFGALEALIIRKVDFSGLGNSYSPEQISTLIPFIADILLCRMGEDCGVGGIVTEQLCWQNGICGGNTEEAILANLRARGLDTTALDQFVSRVLLALQASDTSIFRKPKPGK